MNESFFTPGRILEEAAHVFSDIVPPEAQKHLLNAQREVLLAMAITIEHNSTRRPGKPRATKAKQRSKPAAKRPARVKLD